jgi:superfamily II DNA or RNA helicase
VPSEKFYDACFSHKKLNKFSNPFIPKYNELCIYDIRKKMEECENRYKKIEKLPGKGELFNHQEFAKLYMKNYDRVLVISKPGTGKTCLAIGVAEYFSEIYFNDVNIARITNCIIIK